ncbi:hypothetical protein C3R30_22090, partial [Mycobacterium tuberculosis]
GQGRGEKGARGRPDAQSSADGKAEGDTRDQDQAAERRSQAGNERGPARSGQGRNAAGDKRRAGGGKGTDRARRAAAT